MSLTTPNYGAQQLGNITICTICEDCLSQFKCFLKGFFRALNEKCSLLSWSSFRGTLNKSHPAFVEHSAQVILLSGSHHDPAFVELPMKYTLLLQQSFDNQEFPRLLKNKVFVAKICIYALFESFDGLFCGHQEPANPSYPVSHPKSICISTQLLD